MKGSLFLYNISIRVYYLAIKMASLYNLKAKRWIAGRNKPPTLPKKKNKRIWIHCASLGEFEQGRPLIEHIKKEHPSFEIILSFFSPSGYEIQKEYPLANAVIYLPIDTKQNAQRFIEQVDPDIVMIIKYEFWYHILNELHQKEIPIYLVSGIFRDHQIFFKKYGTLFRNMLHFFDHLFVQDDRSKQLLHSIGVKNSTVSGDTRFDRVSEIAQQKRDVSKLTKWIGNDPCFVAGSTWKKDEILLREGQQNTLFDDWKIILVPHEVDSAHIKDIQHRWNNSILYSEWIDNPDLPLTAQVLIIDVIGLLSAIYRLADTAYVGGGFQKSGIHNVLEAAVYGIPVLFGPNYSRSNEASELLENNAAYCIHHEKDLERIFTKLKDPDTRLQVGKHAYQYVVERTGATEKIIRHLKKVLTEY